MFLVHMKVRLGKRYTLSLFPPFASHQFLTLRVDGHRIIGILQVNGCHETILSDQTECRGECVHFEVLVRNPFIQA